MRLESWQLFQVELMPGPAGRVASHMGKQDQQLRRTLFDAPISSTSFEGHTRSSEMEEQVQFNECPSCHSKQLTPWHTGQLCPSCGANLVMSGDTELWD
jgi:Zn finger protein HypA/HybF involved in hydrogenase expression